MEQDSGCDVVGKIAYDVKLFILFAQGTEVYAEDVGFDYFSRGQLSPESRGQVSIEFYGDKSCRARNENFGDGSGTGADFDDSCTGYVTKRIGNSQRRRWINEKILAEFWFLFQFSSQGKLGQLPTVYTERKNTIDSALHVSALRDQNALPAS